MVQVDPPVGEACLDPEVLGLSWIGERAGNLRGLANEGFGREHRNDLGVVLAGDDRGVHFVQELFALGSESVPGICADELVTEGPIWNMC